MKRNVAAFGLFLGLIMPAIGVLILYLIRFHDEGFNNYIRSIFENEKFGFMILSLSLLMNLIPFSYFNNKRLELSTRGVLIATMLYAVFMVLLRYVW